MSLRRTSLAWLVVCSTLLLPGLVLAQGLRFTQLAFVSHLHADPMGGIDEVDVGTDAVPIDAGGLYKVYPHGSRSSSNAPFLGVTRPSSRSSPCTLSSIKASGGTRANGTAF